VLVAPEVSLTTSDAIADCDDFTLEFPADSAFFENESPAYSNVTATVSSGGGTVEDAFGLIDAGHVLPLESPSSGTGVCGSCCLNEEPTLAEVTVTIEHLIDDPAVVAFLVPEGDYVLSRNGGGAFNMNFTRWSGGGVHVFNGFGRNFTIDAVIEPCGGSVDYIGETIHRAYFATDCGDTCYKKCRLRISLVGPDFNTAPGAYNPGCDCLDFPICSPPAGAYTLAGGAFNTPTYTATIS
jgi:hypothetical protein